MWMQSLSSFCGNLYKKYPSIELVGLLQYITNTLKSGTSLQLLLLRDLVTKMSGTRLKPGGPASLLGSPADCY